MGVDEGRRALVRWGGSDTWSERDSCRNKTAESAAPGPADRRCAWAWRDWVESCRNGKQLYIGVRECVGVRVLAFAMSKCLCARVCG